MEYTKEEVKKIIEYTKHLEYLDAIKPQYNFTAEDILNKWLEKK